MPGPLQRLGGPAGRVSLTLLTDVSHSQVTSSAREAGSVVLLDKSTMTDR